MSEKKESNKNKKENIVDEKTVKTADKKTAKTTKKKTVNKVEKTAAKKSAEKTTAKTAEKKTVNKVEKTAAKKSAEKKSAKKVEKETDPKNVQTAAEDKTGRIVVCGANAYEQKFYFNEDKFGKLPQSIKDELHIICVLFTEEVGGIFTIVVEEDGGISFDTQSAEDDYYYDEISAGLLLSKIRMNRAEMLESISLYYRVFYLHETFES